MAWPVELSQRSRRMIARLGSRKQRKREGLVLVEGTRAVETALDAGAKVRFAVVSPRLEASTRAAAVRAKLDAAGCRVRAISDDDLEEISDTETPQGVLLVAGEPDGSLDIVRRAGRYLVLDGVQDPGNAGTLVRAAAAFALDGVLVLDGTVDVWGPKAVRASAGHVFTVPVVACDADGMLASCLGVGVGLLVADAAGQDVGTFPGGEGFALAVGNEGSGVRSRLSAAARASLAVPMPGPAESLNVGVAGSILLHSLCGMNRRE